MSDKDTIKDALEAFEAIQEAESKNRSAWVDDVRFARLGEQWPAAVKRQRETDGRPCLTLNRLPSFIRQVTNDARMNKPAIRCHPVGDGANKETAEILDGLIRNIEYTSNADVAYDTALEHAVTGGFGYFRISTQYAHDDSFDQDLCIERINNPLSVFGDHRSTAADSSDWNVAFVTENYSNAEFEKKWGKKAEKSDWQSDSHDKGLQWFEDDKVRVAEYWTRDEVPAKILQLTNGIVLAEDVYLKNKDFFDMQGVAVKGDRMSKTMKVKQQLLTASDVLEDNKWAGRYIPLIPVYGDEVVVEGERSFISLIRFAKDSQQMLNYWRTASTELVALAPKAPFIGPRGAFNSNPDKWNTANSVNHAYIEYDGPVPPQRQAFAGPPAGALQEALNASDDMKSIMGIYDASLGARSNETSGRAIIARQHEGDTSTFNFIDNLSRAIRHAGRVLVDMIPHVYTEARIIRVIHEDGENESVPINQPFQPGQDKQQPPTPQQMQEQQEDAEGMMRVYDLTAGKYDVTCEAGPSFSTKRQESSVQMMEFVRSFPASAPIIGDLIAKNLDWPGADDIADRIKAMLPQQAQGANPQLQAMQQQMQQMDAHAKEAVGQLQQQLKEQAQALEDKQFERMQAAEKLQIDKYNAETNRIKALTDAKTAQADSQLETFQAVAAMNSPPQQPMQEQAPTGAFSLPQ
jgi:hypothetical protein